MEVALRELGPTLTWSGLALLGIGSMTVALADLRTGAQAPAVARRRRAGARRRARPASAPTIAAATRSARWPAPSTGWRPSCRRASAALAASDRARRQLLADVSHELMTPLTAIRGYTETLAMPNLTVDPPTRARYFDIVDKETYKLEAIIGDLLDLAKLDGGGGTLTIEPLAVDDLFDRIAERHEPSLRARNITLEQEVPEDLELDGDLQRLEQALQNVASNAVRHTPDGGRVRPARRAARLAGAHHHSRQRTGDPSRAPAAHLRPVLQGRSRPADRGRVGQRARPVDRPRHRRAARRHGHGGQRPRRRRDLRVPPAAPTEPVKSAAPVAGSEAPAERLAQRVRQSCHSGSLPSA